MYLKPQIHGTQDTLTIHVGYIGIVHRDTYKDTYLEPYLRPRLDTPKPPRYVSRMYLACIPHVFRMYSACIPHVSWLPLRIHVSRMYLACIPHVSFISDTSLSGCIWDTCISSCISDVSQMYLDHPCRYMYLACIPHVSCISDTYLSGYIQEVCISECIPYVSRICILMYRDVSWWRVQDTRILMYPDMYPVWHQGSAQDTCIVT